MTEQTEKVVVKLIGVVDGNVFSIMGAVSRALKKAGQYEQAKAYQEAVLSCDSYDKALRLTMEYVEVE